MQKYRVMANETFGRSDQFKAGDIVDFLTDAEAAPYLGYKLEKVEAPAETPKKEAKP